MVHTIFFEVVPHTITQSIMSSKNGISPEKIRETENMGSNPSEPLNPHPSFIQVARPYIFEKTIQDCKAVMGVNPLREEASRLQGVTRIDSVRRMLHL